LRIGIDFGTSNSAVAVVFDDGRTALARFTHALADQEGETTPTVLFFPSYEPETHFGHAAVARYLYTGLEGRFVQSMKTYLPSAAFTGTQIRGRSLAIEDLVAIFLRRLIEAAQRTLGVTLEGPTAIGRPARFSLEPEADALAQRRLLQAVAAVGLGRAKLVLEPVAAALAYEAELDRDEVVLVADLGGGTSDFTLMEVGPSHQARIDRQPSILASRGVPIAGDKIDGEIVRAALLEPLGAGSDYLALTDRTAVPRWIFQRLLQWNHVSFLKSKETLEFLRTVHRTSNRPEAIGRLLRIVEEDQGYLLFRAVERAKRELGSADRASIADREHDLAVEAVIDRSTFEVAARPLIDRMIATAEETLLAARIAADQVDTVFLTGGTSLLAPVRRRFEALFGPDKLRGGKTFTSVVRGLARAAATET
jgi:hypothetical chaperone protein